MKETREMLTVNSRLSSVLAPASHNQPAGVHQRKVLRRLVANPSIRADDDDGLPRQINLDDRRHLGVLILEERHYRFLSHS